MKIPLLPYPNITFPSYRTEAFYHCSSDNATANTSETTSLESWITLETKFMAVVQPEKPNAEFIASLQNKSVAMVQNLPSAALDLLESPELGGVLTLTIIGLLYVILMPLMGLFWCFYRCLCRKKKQRFDPKGYSGRRLCVSAALFCVVAVLISASALVLTNGSNLVDFTDQLLPAAENAFLDLETLVNDTESHIAFATRQGFAAMQYAVETNLNQSGTVIGIPVLGRLNDLGFVADIYEMVLLARNATVNVSPMLTDIDRSITDLGSNARKLKGQLDDLAESLTESDCPDGCAIIGPLARQLKVNVDLTTFDMASQMNGLNSMISGGFAESTEEGYNELMNMSSILQNKTEPARTKTLLRVHQFGEDLDHYTGAVDNFTSPMLTTIHSQSENIHGYATMIHGYGLSAHAAVIVVGVLLLLVALTTLAGCLCGGLSFDRTSIPTRRSGKVTYGGCSLMCAVYTILLFAWILMLCTTAFFIFGTQLDAVFCPLLQGSENNFTLLDEVMEVVQNTTRKGEPITLLANETLRPGHLLTKCMHNATLYNLLNLGLVFDVYDIDKRLKNFNISGVLEGLKVSIDDMTIFSPKSESLANDFLTAISVNFSSYLNELSPSKPLIAGNLSLIREALSESTGTNDYISRNVILIEDVEKQVHTMDLMRASLTNRIVAFESVAQHFQPTTVHLLEKSRIVQRFMENDASNFVYEIAQEFADEIYELAREFVSFVVTTVVDKIGPCRPLYDALTSVANLLCDSLITSLNGLWFSLGLGLLICIPILFCNCHLAKYYSRAEFTDVSEDLHHVNAHHRPLLHNPLSNIRKIRPAPPVITVQVAPDPEPSFGVL